MNSIILLSVDYNYTCEIGRRLAVEKKLPFIDIVELVEYELTAFSREQDWEALVEQTILKVINSNDSVVAMDIKFFSILSVKNACLNNKNLIYLVVEHDIISVQKYAKVEFDIFMSQHTKNILYPCDISKNFNKIKVEENDN